MNPNADSSWLFSILRIRLRSEIQKDNETEGEIKNYKTHPFPQGDVSKIAPDALCNANQ